MALIVLYHVILPFQKFLKPSHVLKQKQRKKGNLWTKVYKCKNDKSVTLFFTGLYTLRREEY